MALTRKKVDAAKPKKKGDKPKRTVTWDEDIPAFGLKLYASGKRSYIVRYRTRDTKRERFLTLGNASVLTVTEARDLAKEVLGAVAKGEDPVQERRDARNEAEKHLTFEELAQKWGKLHARPKLTNWKQEVRRLDLLLPTLGKRRADSITNLDLTELHTDIGEARGRVEANRVLVLVGSVFTKAKEWDLLPSDFKNPASKVEHFKERGRIRTVKSHEFSPLLEAIGRYPDPFVAGAILTLLFTGLRKTDALRLKWSDVDMGAGVIILRSQKTDEPRFVPMSAATRKVLESMPHLQDNPYIFCGRKEGQHLKSITRAWEKIRTEAGCPDLWIHDFKRTIGTSIARAGQGSHVIRSVLGHKSDRMARRYVALAVESLSGVMDTYADEVEALANGEAPPLVAGSEADEEPR